ncbi:MAG: GNAT family N-acetyltransferase [Coriobacteriia bacterium]|nr:GNAT family N-acetyltransferase [Coriobacteriia bacterium]
MPFTDIVIVTHDWPRFGEVLDLSYDVLYGPFGVARDAEWYHPAHGSQFAVALDEGGRILGTARLLPVAGGVSRQVRQVMVAPHAHGQGVGRLLMQTLEDLARSQDAEELWLNARYTAYGFYEKLGYFFEGPEFASELTGIAHRTMRKSLA